MTMIIRTARTSTTTSGPCITPPSFGAHEQRQPFLAGDAAALTDAQRPLAVVLDRPLRAAQLGLADRARRQFLERDRDLVTQRVDVVAAAARCAEAVDEAPPEQQHRSDRQDREEQPLHHR